MKTALGLTFSICAASLAAGAVAAEKPLLGVGLLAAALVALAWSFDRILRHLDSIITRSRD